VRERERERERDMKKLWMRRTDECVCVCVCVGVCGHWTQFNRTSIGGATNKINPSRTIYRTP